MRATAPSCDVVRRPTPESRYVALISTVLPSFEMASWPGLEAEVRRMANIASAAASPSEPTRCPSSGNRRPGCSSSSSLMMTCNCSTSSAVRAVLVKKGSEDPGSDTESILVARNGGWNEVFDSCASSGEMPTGGEVALKNPDQGRCGSAQIGTYRVPAGLGRQIRHGAGLAAVSRSAHEMRSSAVREVTFR